MRLLGSGKAATIGQEKRTESRDGVGMVLGAGVEEEDTISTGRVES